MTLLLLGNRTKLKQKMETFLQNTDLTRAVTKCDLITSTFTEIRILYTRGHKDTQIHRWTDRLIPVYP